MLPMLVRLKIVEDGRKKIDLWFPVIIVWLLMLALLILLLPFLLLAAILTWGRGPGKYILAVYPMLASVLFNLSDLRVEVEGREKSLLISFQ